VDPKSKSRQKLGLDIKKVEKHRCRCLIPVTLQPNFSGSPPGGPGNYKVCLFYGYTLFNSNMWMLYSLFILYNVLWVLRGSILQELADPTGWWQ